MMIRYLLTISFLLFIIFLMLTLFTVLADYVVPTVSVGFRIPDFGTVLSFILRLFFIVAGLAALIYLLLGAFAWVTSGGEKEAVGKAREKIQAAVIGLILIFVVLAIVVLLEKILGIGLGLSENISFPQLIKRE